MALSTLIQTNLLETMLGLYHRAERRSERAILASLHCMVNVDTFRLVISHSFPLLSGLASAIFLAF
jgi:hypothetical protein